MVSPKGMRETLIFGNLRKNTSLLLLLLRKQHTKLPGSPVDAEVGVFSPHVTSLSTLQTDASEASLLPWALSASQSQNPSETQPGM